MLSAARQALDSIASSQIALSVPTSLQLDMARIAQNLSWSQADDLTSLASHPALAWSRAGMNSVDAASILPVTGRLFLPNISRDYQQSISPPLPFAAITGQATLQRMTFYVCRTCCVNEINEGINTTSNRNCADRLRE
jgi:hypothetical protein